MIGQELQIILIKLKLQRMLLQNLQKDMKRWIKIRVRDGEGGRDRERGEVRVCVTAGSCPCVVASHPSSA